MSQARFVKTYSPPPVSTKDVNLLRQLFQSDQLILSPDYQRESVWPKAAQAYLIDTILESKPMPLIFFHKGRDLQSGKNVYYVVDGQQRLRAIFDFIDDKFKLTETKAPSRRRKRYSQLTPIEQDAILNYELFSVDLTGYSQKDIEDIFARMNKYGVKLSRQELRRAKFPGAFQKFVVDLSKLPFWTESRVFTELQMRRKKAEELAAELVILLEEGPQDKKASVDSYYEKYVSTFPPNTRVRKEIKHYLGLVREILPEVKNTRYRKPVDLYSLIGALAEIESEGGSINRSEARKRLIAFEAEIEGGKNPAETAAYIVAASQQTDNVKPRTQRIKIIKALLLGKLSGK